jgi:hypothetical protein
MPDPKGFLSAYRLVGADRKKRGCRLGRIELVLLWVRAMIPTSFSDDLFVRPGIRCFKPCCRAHVAPLLVDGTRLAEFRHFLPRSAVRCSVDHISEITRVNQFVVPYWQ